jgi:hypothetical protein
MREMSYLSTAEAWKVAVGSLLWWPNYSVLRQWGGSTVELLLLLVLWVIAPMLLLLRSA